MNEYQKNKEIWND
ncbi:hypothetical protein WDK94_003018 [Listeria monocytogenes]|nr:hypothetical protein [Listeria monocytogenes]EGL4216688.1 hypothetical protein [Listeria monocytogenes]EJE4791031.1 hypothetical protein [Listeria monocytogenes]EJE4827463.1 hypothetical protein [Listeria monocytogenes]EJE5082470.1 hypothetical protein [Listeria monocytogenes]